MERDQFYLQQAYLMATQSPDTSNQNGACLLTAAKEEMSLACNEFQLDYTDEEIEALLADRDEKLKYIEHAERNAIYSAVFTGEEVYDSTLYCPWAACHDCARAIVGTGIRELVVHRPRMNETPTRWVDSIKAAMALLEKAEVKVTFVDGPIPGTEPIIVNGKLWSPEALGFVV